MIANNSKSKRIATQAVWDETQKHLLLWAKPHRVLVGLLAMLIMSVIISYNGFDVAGLRTSVDALWVEFCFLLPLAVAFAIDIDLVGPALVLLAITSFFLLNERNILAFVVKQNYVSPALPVLLSPPRRNSF